MLIKAREDATKGGPPPETTPQVPGSSGPPKLDREGQRPTQPVYQIQNRGMGASASSTAVDRKFVLILVQVDLTIGSHLFTMYPYI